MLSACISSRFLLGLEGIVSPMRMNPILKSQAYIHADPPAEEAEPTVYSQPNPK